MGPPRSRPTRDCALESSTISATTYSKRQSPSARAINPPILVFNKLCRQRRSVGFFADPAKTFGYFYSKSCALSQAPGPAVQALLEYVNGHLST
jgi:hypothetical protein